MKDFFKLVEVEILKYKIGKKLPIILSMLVIMATLMFQPTVIQAEKGLDLAAESAILVDAETGKVLYSKDSDIALPPASMTKMMTEYLVWEAVESGEISWDTKTEISDYPYDLSADANFSGVGLRQNVEYTVQELYEAMAINSDNATTIALAELIAGSEAEFVKLMNAKGEEMGLPDYEFVNTTGLENTSLGDNYPEGTDPDGTNLLSSRSAALLAYHLVNDFPESLEISSIPEIAFDDQTITNWNWMLPHDTTYLKQFHYEGVDGLKTGFTELAGYCFTGTAEVDGKRLIAVVMKTASEAERFKETAKLFDYGFDNFEMQELFPSGYQLKDKQSLPVAKGKKKTVEVATKDAFELPIKESDEEKFSVKYSYDKKLLNEDGELIAPIEKGQKIGTAKLVYEDKEDAGYIHSDSKGDSVDLITEDSVEKKNWFMTMLATIGAFFKGLFTSIVDLVKGWF